MRPRREVKRNQSQKFRLTIKTPRIAGFFVCYDDPMSREITVRGILIARRSIGEGSVRVSIYTDSLGLIVALAKSAREERSKLRAHLQEGTVGSYTLVKGRDAWRVTGAVDTRNAYFACGDSPKIKEAVARVMATVRQFVRGEGSDPYLFSVLSNFLRATNGFANDEIMHAECLAVLRMLAALGYVETKNGTEQFFSTDYGEKLLALAAKERPRLIRTINESIAVSGL